MCVMNLINLSMFGLKIIDFFLKLVNFWSTCCVFKQRTFMKIQVDYVRPTISLWLLYDLLIFERSKSDNHLFPDSQGSYNFTILQMFKCLT